MYKRVYVVEPTHDVSGLLQFAEKIVFLFSGYESSVLELREAFERNIAEFEATTDAFVPIGKMRDVTVASMLLRSKTKLPISVGIYRDKTYTFERIQ